MCNEILGLCKNPHIEELPVEKVAANILSTKPDFLKNDDFINNLYAQIASDTNPREVIKTVHISDIHMDKKYLEGALVKCGSYLCCRAEMGMPGPGQAGAREWGERTCDTVPKLVENMMQFIANDLNPDMMFWTGDNAAHNDWDNSVEEVIDYTVSISDMIKEAFKGKNLTVVPTHGNHDTWPTDQHDFNVPSPVLAGISQAWVDFIGDEAAAKYKENGFYSVDVSKLKNGKTLPAGSKIITLNTNACEM